MILKLMFFERLERVENFGNILDTSVKELALVNFVVVRKRAVSCRLPMWTLG